MFKKAFYGALPIPCRFPSTTTILPSFKSLVILPQSEQFTAITAHLINLEYRTKRPKWQQPRYLNGSVPVRMWMLIKYAKISLIILQDCNLENLNCVWYCIAIYVWLVHNRIPLTEICHILGGSCYVHFPSFVSAILKQMYSEIYFSKSLK